ncbi:hypothetical protein ACFLVP_01995 [Chloroflexota bacterium]
MWFIIAGVIVAGMILALFLKALRDELVMKNDIEKWEEEGYDLGDFKERWPDKGKNNNR